MSQSIVGQVSRYYVLDEDGTARKCSIEEWIALRMEHNTCHVGLTNFDNGFVSTVFLGLDHNFGMNKNDCRPHIFETLISGPKNSGVVDRYSTYQEAKEGHERWVYELARRLNQVAPQIENRKPWLTPGDSE